MSISAIIVDFNKVFLQGQPVDEYLQLLIKEMKISLEQFPTKQIDTIFVGGGTPTALNEKQLEILCEGIRLTFLFIMANLLLKQTPVIYQRKNCKYCPNMVLTD